MSEQTKIKHSPAVEGKKHHKVRWIVLAVLLAIAFGGMAGGVVGMMAALPLVVCVRGAVRGWRE